MKHVTVANTILEQIGFLSRGCLDMKGSQAYALDNGVVVTDCLVSTTPNRRGTIQITVNAADLYDVKFVRADFKEIEYNDLTDVQMSKMFGEVSGSQMGGVWSQEHRF